MCHSVTMSSRPSRLTDRMDDDDDPMDHARSPRLAVPPAAPQQVGVAIVGLCWSRYSIEVMASPARSEKADRSRPTRPGTVWEMLSRLVAWDVRPSFQDRASSRVGAALRR